MRVPHINAVEVPDGAAPKPDRFGTSASDVASGADRDLSVTVPSDAVLVASVGTTSALPSALFDALNAARFSFASLEREELGVGAASDGNGAAANGLSRPFNHNAHIRQAVGASGHGVQERVSTIACCRLIRKPEAHTNAATSVKATATTAHRFALRSQASAATSIAKGASAAAATAAATAARLPARHTTRSM